MIISLALSRQLLFGAALLNFNYTYLWNLHPFLIGSSTPERAPRFLVSWWDCYEVTLAGEDRAINFAEAAPWRLHDALVVDQPTVGRLLQDLKRIQRSHDMHF
uniref:Uncharacterized protein n=1 Tax=Ditylenchus dipsaci TaxID=166011 RepID=A0A915DFQ0_9BILA